MVTQGPKVLHMIDSEGVYGAEQVLINLLPQLRSLGVKPALACLSPISANGADVGRILSRNSNIPVFFLNEAQKASFRVLRRIYGCLRDTGAEILHVHGYKAAILGGLVAKFARVPIVMTYHGEAAQCPELSMQVRLETLFLSSMAFVIAVSERIRTELRSRGMPDDRIGVIQNGINDLATVRVEKEKGIRSMNYNPHLLCVGRLVQIKRFDLAIRAVAELRRIFPNVGLSIAGTGPMKTALETLVSRLGLSDVIEFLGYVDDMPKLYSVTDIVVISSDTEGSPMSLLEAMSFSLPIVATAVGGIPDMVTHGTDCLLCSPGDVMSVVNAINQIMTDQTFRFSLSANARATFERDYKAEVMARKYQKVYGRIIS